MKFNIFCMPHEERRFELQPLDEPIKIILKNESATIKTEIHAIHDYNHLIS